MVDRVILRAQRTCPVCDCVVMAHCLHERQSSLSAGWCDWLAFIYSLEYLLLHTYEQLCYRQWGEWQYRERIVRLLYVILCVCSGGRCREQRERQCSYWHSWIHNIHRAPIPKNACDLTFLYLCRGCVLYNVRRGVLLMGLSFALLSRAMSDNYAQTKSHTRDVRPTRCIEKSTIDGRTAVHRHTCNKNAVP